MNFWIRTASSWRIVSIFSIFLCSIVDYFCHVNLIDPCAFYDEEKHFAGTLSSASTKLTSVVICTKFAIYLFLGNTEKNIRSMYIFLIIFFLLPLIPRKQ